MSRNICPVGHLEACEPSIFDGLESTRSKSSSVAARVSAVRLPGEDIWVAGTARSIASSYRSVGVSLDAQPDDCSSGSSA